MEYIQAIILFGLIAFAGNWIAATRGFYTLPYHRREGKELSFKSVAIVFTIYFTATTVVAVLIARLAEAIYALLNAVPPITLFGWVQLIVIAITAILFYLYCRTLDRTLIKKIWKDWSIPHPKPITWDFCVGAMTWIIGFPLVIVVGQFADMIVYFFSGFQTYEQVAVRYLRMALDSPSMLAIALFMIIFAAPVIEEFLFRGFLQTYLKRHMDVKKAIVFSSICFALFHLAPSQGLGNISLVLSLFTFALFLGFIYERQASLFASIGLHITFNTLSTLRILFAPES